MLDIKRILVPLDFSANSEYALEYAYAMAQRFGATLDLLHVCDVPAETSESMDMHTVAAGMGTLCAVGVLALALLVPGVAAAQAPPPVKNPLAGAEMFRMFCATCHGTAARGDGPLASSMTRKPADLTEIAKRNGGLFPAELVFRTIDGRKPIRGHGGADMPVWGDAFTRSREGGDPERVKNVIQSLVDFLETIQTRPVH